MAAEKAINKMQQRALDAVAAQRKYLDAMHTQLKTEEELGRISREDTTPTNNACRTRRNIGRRGWTKSRHCWIKGVTATPR